MSERWRKTEGAAVLVVAILAAFAQFGAAEGTTGTASVVKVEKTADGFRLVRNGQPYFIKGGGGADTAFLMDQMVAAGGNSLRLWNANAGEVYDRAAAHGLTVCPTLWMGRDNNTAADKGTDYADATRVQGLIDKAREAVTKFKDHPALLLWGVGNEMESPGLGSPDLWKAIDKVAAMVHMADPNHPTLTVIADLGRDGAKVKSIMQYCPHIDILGVNSYGGAVSLAKRLAAAGWDRPYIVTEFGADDLSLKKTPWGAKIEPPTTQRAAKLTRIYEASIAPGHPACLGSYVFIWRQSTDYGGFHSCFMPSGERLGHVDAMTEAWTGKPPKNRCPEIQPIASDAAGCEVPPGAQIAVRTSVKDPDGGNPKTRWEIRSEKIGAKGDKRSFGQPVASGDATPIPPASADGDTKKNAAPATDGSREVSFNCVAPAAPGPYRLFVIATDGAGNAAYAAMPFHAGPYKQP